MTISYNWLLEYLPGATGVNAPSLDPERISKILTSVGLEVESLEQYEEIKGGMQGLLIGEVMTCGKHLNADKLSVTTVNIGKPDPVQIVCGASNVAVGQKVIVAPVGTTIFPIKGSPITMKVAKIRGIESHGMICSEDEVGLGTNHEGIVVLPVGVRVGSSASEYFKPYTDWIFEIGLTPNRMDAMSHLGVAKDVCAYLAHHDKSESRVQSPLTNGFKTVDNSMPVSVIIQNTNACQRYSGISIRNVSVKESPQWLQKKIKSIGQRPINNIVDITNFILHETGQPLHAFDIRAIKGNKIIVQNLPAGTPFVSLDGKKRTLDADDLIICNGENEGMCIAGVFGGSSSGVSMDTTSIFLESAWFNPIDIRKTSFRHGLRTDAATRFEKNTDISNTVPVLKRAALLIVELAGGELASEIIDVYPDCKPKTEIILTYYQLKKLSGKNYHPDTVKKILLSLGFEIIREGIDTISIAVPYNKPDIRLPADIVEEIMRIDGLDNIEIPSSITISPSAENFGYKHTWKEKTANYLVGLGFNEIFTNSITNAAYFDSLVLEKAVKLLNNLSADHNIMRPSMLETGLESIAYNINRKNNNLQFFEFGKTYHTEAPGNYLEGEHLCLYITGNAKEDTWKKKDSPADFYYVKGIVANLLQLAGFNHLIWEPVANSQIETGLVVRKDKEVICKLGLVQSAALKQFDIKQAVLFADFYWENLLALIQNNTLKVTELPKQLTVHRDLSLIVPSWLSYSEVEKTVKTVRLDKLQEIKLFDIFESDKLGKEKKSMAVRFTFLDAEKTLTDKEIDSMMNSIMTALEKQLSAEIRK